LPAEWTSFVGRRRELADLRRLLAEHRLVTLTGVAGVGKSRLALRAADQLVRTTPGGVWWVELDQVPDPELVPHAVLHALEIGGPVEAEPLPRIAAFLAERASVLVLDNCEHLVDACAGLVRWLLREVGSLRVLTTSREVLRVPGERVLPVEALRVPARTGPVPRQLAGAALTAYPAVALFAQRATAAVPSFALTPDNETTVAAICRRLDGLPLAIELAAVRLRVLSPEQILHRLEDQLDLLASGSRTASARQRTLRGALDWSHDLCSPAERWVWAQLSVFAGSFDLAAAEHVCLDEDGDPHALAEVLDGLVGKSILLRADHAGQVRFRLPSTLRRYAREKLGAQEEPIRQARHAAWYRSQAEQAERESFGPGELEWLARLRQEHANLRAAVEYGLTDQSAMGLVSTLWYYWTNAAPAAEAQYWLDRVLAHDPRPTRERAKALWVAAYVATVRYDFPAADRRLAQAEELASELADTEALAWVANRRAILALLREDYAGAISWAQEAVDRFGAIGPRETAGSVNARQTLASAYLLRDNHYASDLDTVERIHQECRTICARRGERTHLGWTLLSLGLVRWLRGDASGAARHLRDALRLRRSMPQPTLVCLALEALGCIAGSAGDHERAAVLFGGVEQTAHLLVARLRHHAGFTGPHDECVAQARKTLGDAGYAEAFQRGAGLSQDELIGYGLGEKSHPETDAGTEVATLTARERQVAELVAQGLSNRQISTRLVISQRTAETHIEHVLRKLNFTSRTQIAAWAAHLGV
jgi:non-specific serine/threonine protein kinase